MGSKIFLILFGLLLPFYVVSQTKDNFGYTEITNEDYTRIVKEGKETKLDGKYYIRHNPKGKLLGISKIEYISGKRHGEWLFFLSHMGGIDLSNVENYSFGKKNGYYFSTDNHTYSEQGYYKNDKKHGEWNTKKNNGIGYLVTIREHYKNGKKHGAYNLKENSDGNISITTGKYKNDKKEGVWLIEDTSIGQVTKEVYKDGVLIK